MTAHGARLFHVSAADHAIGTVLSPGRFGAMVRGPENSPDRYRRKLCSPIVELGKHTRSRSPLVGAAIAKSTGLPFWHSIPGRGQAISSSLPSRNCLSCFFN